jgi:ankyrin repeat protein
MRAGDAEAVRNLPQTLVKTWRGVPHGWLLIHEAVDSGHPACIAALADAGAGGTFGAFNIDGNTPAILAAKAGHTACLEMLVQQGCASSLEISARGTLYTAAHLAACEGHAECLRVLARHGASPTFALTDAKGATPAIAAARSGHSECLDVLFEHAGVEALVITKREDGRTPAHVAASHGQARFLTVLAKHGASATFVLGDAKSTTPAMIAAYYGHPECIDVRFECSGVDALTMTNRTDKQTPAHFAAKEGRAECLKRMALHAGADALRATARAGKTPAYYAAQNGHTVCIDVLAELNMVDTLCCCTASHSVVHVAASNGHLDVLKRLRSAFTNYLLSQRPLFEAIQLQNHAFQALGATTIETSEIVDTIKVHTRLAIDSAGESPVEAALDAEHLDCVRYLVQIGGATELHDGIAADPDSLESWPENLLLTEPGLLNFACKRAWISHVMQSAVDDAGSAELALHSRRGAVLDGLCSAMGVNETTGELVSNGGGGVAPQPMAVQYIGEAAAGAGLRREWFDEVVREIMDGKKGLFRSGDGGRTKHPNGDSAVLAGPDHLSYFALLGRIAGLALYHREAIDVRWTDAFVKAVLEMPVVPDDLELVDPELHANKVVYLRSLGADDVAALELTFEDDPSSALMGTQPSIPLKEGGAEIGVTRDNLEEYLQLWVEHRLVGSIRSQVKAFQNGLGVFVPAELRRQLRDCCTACDFQLMVSGTPVINVADWKASTVYTDGLVAESVVVSWFWTLVQGMGQADQAALLHFVTGSSRAPADGFTQLMG